MKELDYINIIKNELDDNTLLGDDCAYLKDLGIFITQDTLIEDVHFTLHTITPYLLGRKAVSVNLSDLAASMAQPNYISVSVSLPKRIKESFMEELYKGINDVCKKYGVKVSGGDITGSDKVTISICAIGKKDSKYISSRSYAKKGDYVLVTGRFGSSGAGLYALQNFLYADNKLIDAHLNPVPKIKEALKLKELITDNLAIMDTSDGLIDALYKIASDSKRNIEIDINKVPVDKELIEFCKYNNLNYKDFVKWGAEDYELLICANEETYNKLDKNIFIPIGKVLNKDTTPYVNIKDNGEIEKITKEKFDKMSYNHF